MTGYGLNIVNCEHISVCNVHHCVCVCVRVFFLPQIIVCQRDISHRLIHSMGKVLYVRFYAAFTSNFSFQSSFCPTLIHFHHKVDEMSITIIIIVFRKLWKSIFATIKWHGYKEDGLRHLNYNFFLRILHEHIEHACIEFRLNHASTEYHI